MKRLIITTMILSTLFSQKISDQEMVNKIFDEVMVNGKSYELLEYLCKKIGNRLSGSENYEKAVKWSKKVMEEYGFDRVYLQEVMVPKWVRGNKEVVKITGSDKALSALAIGGSIATPENGMEADVVAFDHISEIAKAGKAKIEGKIVFLNNRFDQRLIETFKAYSKSGPQRWQGAVEAAKYGAVAVVVRSLASSTDDYPHTGGLRYDEKIKKIPALAISTLAADILEKETKKSKVRLFLKMNPKWHDDVKSYNVIGEIKGSEKPDEFIVIGGHLDSWDVGEGAHDDGSGCVQSIDALRTFKKLKIKPRHTIRVVMFANEENGLRGGTEYARVAKEKNEKHIAAIESDAGGFSPRGFSVQGPENVIKKMQNWLEYFNINTISYIVKGFGGADIGPLNQTQNTVCIGLNPDSQRYFTLHHTDNDVFEEVNRRELLLGAASMTSLLYLVDKYGL